MIVGVDANVGAWRGHPSAVTPTRTHMGVTHLPSPPLSSCARGSSQSIINPSYIIHVASVSSRGRIANDV